MRNPTALHSVDERRLDHVIGGGKYNPAPKTNWSDWGHGIGDIALNQDISEGSQDQPQRQT